MATNEQYRRLLQQSMKGSALMGGCCTGSALIGGGYNSASLGADPNVWHEDNNDITNKTIKKAAAMRQRAKIIATHAEDGQKRFVDTSAAIQIKVRDKDYKKGGPKYSQRVPIPGTDRYAPMYKTITIRGEDAEEYHTKIANRRIAREISGPKQDAINKMAIREKLRELNATRLTEKLKPLTKLPQSMACMVKCEQSQVTKQLKREVKLKDSPFFGKIEAPYNLQMRKDFTPTILATGKGSRGPREKVPLTQEQERIKIEVSERLRREREKVKATMSYTDMMKLLAQHRKILNDAIGKRGFGPGVPPTPGRSPDEL